MLNKNDPLINSVKQVMEQNARERAAAQSVNEKFGITDRKALPHNRQGEWDTAYKKVLSESVISEDEMNDGGKGKKQKMWVHTHKTSGKEKHMATDKPISNEWSVSPLKEELKGDQPKLDVNKNKRIDSEDLRTLRMKKIIQSRKKALDEGMADSLNAWGRRTVDTITGGAAKYANAGIDYAVKNAGAAIGIGSGTTYSKELDQEKEKLANDEKNHPIASGMGNVGSGNAPDRYSKEIAGKANDMMPAGSDKPINHDSAKKAEQGSNAPAKIDQDLTKPPVPKARPTPPTTSQIKKKSVDNAAATSPKAQPQPVQKPKRTAYSDMMRRAKEKNPY